ncbi:MAG: DUF3581 family protein [Oceanisphaera sp.]|nr:DUF3581 family protein [Oceanisphaera sp.]
MLFDPFFETAGEHIVISAQQASRFAKTIAGDFNPIHDADAKRFCVPGDLLFSLVLYRYGLSQQMDFTFQGMVGADVPLYFPNTNADAFEITDDQGKAYLQVQRRGATSNDPAVIESLTRRYVAFSGQNFPHVLQPLLAEQQVMFNPQRPLVIYQRMGFKLQTLVFDQLDLRPDRATLDVQGKRGDVRLAFQFTDGERIIGEGDKTLIISSLRPYDDAAMQQVIADYQQAAGNPGP